MGNIFEARVIQVIQRTYNVKSYRLEVKDSVDFIAGQFLLLMLKTEPELKRYLSISSSPTEKGYVEFTKKITQSDFSQRLNSLTAGGQVRIQYPFGRFTLDEPRGKIAFISGGIGITPIRSICRYVVDKDLGTDMVLVYANRSIKDIVFREDFEAMQQAYPKLHVYHVLREAAEGFQYTRGLINSQVIKKAVPDYKERKFYICGPPQMVESMRRMLGEELVLGERNIVTENFQGY